MTSLTSESPTSSLIQNASFTCPSGNNCTSPCYKCTNSDVQNSTEKPCAYAQDNNDNKMAADAPDVTATWLRFILILYLSW